MNNGQRISYVKFLCGSLLKMTQHKEDDLVTKNTQKSDTGFNINFKKLSLSLAVAGGLVLSTGFAQQSWAQEEDNPGELARESLELMMKSLSLVIDSIPQYEMPVITENGDIIIRRKQKDDWEDLDETPEPKENEDSKQI
ncbi:hypothetical protein WH96_19310 [Kiloniella spongiae]|uniref:Uncharacterized protein n=2 Tax=Kiloniella spongiae TaxID=1489064 RepID=A0A0H2M9C8_9PROT|nr:hypothetical protein WH96_19310 [Kiloniella spongiae]